MLRDILARLEERRAELRMPMAVLARRSNVNLRTVYRVLRAGDASASVKIVEAIAEALRMRIDLRPEVSSERLLLDRARQTARKLAEMTQATAALEGQAVNTRERLKLERMFVHKLMAGTSQQLWGPPRRKHDRQD